MSETLDPQKFHILTKKQKIITLIGLAVATFVILPVVGFFYYTFAINRPSQSSKDTTYELKSGSGFLDVGKDLSAAGAINSEFLFDAYIWFNRLGHSIQAGVYKIPSGSSIVEVVNQLQHGTNDISITFTEGWRVEEFARAATLKFSNVDYEKFVTIAKDSEGLLFPDTYYFNADIDEAQLIDELKGTFTSKTKDLLTSANLEKAHLTQQQAIIFASIVEREVAKSEDRPIVAGILIKRWRNNELIGADATTQYAIARNRVGCQTSNSNVCPTDGLAMEMLWWPSDLSVDDINFDSAYNTRKNVGLPPAPISSFGLEALESVLNYKTTEYQFYLTDKEGVTHYARTYDAHQANIAKYAIN
jgi:UPF0755 protein